MKDIQIVNISKNINLIPMLVKWHYQQWGDLTGASSENDYQKLLFKYASSQKVPMKKSYGTAYAGELKCTSRF